MALMVCDAAGLTSNHPPRNLVMVRGPTLCRQMSPFFRRISFAVYLSLGQLCDVMVVVAAAAVAAVARVGVRVMDGALVVK